MHLKHIFYLICLAGLLVIGTLKQIPSASATTIQPTVENATFSKPDAPLDKQLGGIIGTIVSIFLPTTATTTSPSTATVATPQRNCTKCTCGRINTFKRIVGGEETEVNEYPWMAMLRENGRFFCGGSLINDNYVATAAHCVRTASTRTLSVRLLAFNRTSASPDTFDRNVTSILIKENYNPRTQNNDIALLRLSQPVQFNDVLRPVCMPIAGMTYAGDMAVVTGWGDTSEDGSLANTLQEVYVPVLTNEVCKMNTTYQPSQITENMLCAGDLEGGKDSCQGDSGGPLHVSMSATTDYQLAGIVSWGKGCARPNTPGVYARVTQYLNWIAERTLDACKCDPPSDSSNSVEEF